MKETIATLKKLHIFDRRLTRIERDLKILPKRLEEIDASFTGKRASMDTLQRRQERVEISRKQKHDFLNQERTHLEVLEKRQLGVKNEKEMGAVTREIEASRKIIKNVEEEVARFDAEITEVRNKRTEFGQQIEDGRKTFQAETDDINGRIAKATADLAAKQDERNKIAAGLDKAMLGKYERVRKHQGFALAMVRGGLCHACFMHIPPQTYNLVQKGEQIQLCPSCHRILVEPDDDLLEAEKEVTAPPPVVGVAAEAAPAPAADAPANPPAA